MNTKKIISVLLCICMLSGVCAAGFTASAEEPDFVVFNNCDDLYSWTNMSGGGSNISIDTENKLEGTGSVKIDLDADHVKQASIFALMTTVDAETPVSINKYPYCEVMLHLYDDLTTNSGLQINLVDTDVHNQDGWNMNNPINSYSAGWHRITSNSTGVRLEKPGSSADHITRLRLSWILYADYYEVDWGFDNIIFFDEAFKTARAEKEGQMVALISEATEPTADNIATTEAEVLELMDTVTKAQAEYPNMMLDNITKYNRIVNAYYSLKKADLEADAVEKINAIGDVTYENFNEKLSLIVAAEESIAKLTELFGSDYTVSNKDILTAARKAYDDNVVAGRTVQLISDLTPLEEITLTDKFPINEAKKSYDALSEAQKALVIDEWVNTLNAAVQKLYDLEHPYVLGQVDDDDSITASDALLTLQQAVGKIELSELKLLAADVDNNEGVTAADALLILQYAVGKIDSFPKEAK